MFKLKKGNKLSKIDSLSSSEKMLHGTAWLSAGLLISRLLGALYIIPWSRWIGEHYEIANALYAVAYAPYVLFLDIATAGLPTALTKKVSQFNAQGKYKSSMALFKNSLMFMIILGILSATLLYFSAFFVASISIQPTKDLRDSIVVIQSLAPALLLFPVMSLLRGFFLGFQQSTIPAVSQIIEQLIRIIYMLCMTYYVMHIKKGSLVEAVSQSTLAAFFGAIVSLLFLSYQFLKEKDYFKQKMAFDKNAIEVTSKDSILIMTKESIPFVLMSMGSALLNTIDQILYSPAMQDFSNYSIRQIAVSYAWFSANIQKLLSIVGSLITAVVTMSIPNIALLYNKGNKKNVAQSIADTINLFCFLVIPVTIGLFIVANSIYRVFYGDANGGEMLKVGLISFSIGGFYAVLISFFNGMGKFSIALKGLSIVLLTKVAVYPFMIMLLQEKGALTSTIIASILACYFLYAELKHMHLILVNEIFSTLFKIVNSTIIMAIVSIIINWLLVITLTEFGMLTNLLRVLLVGIFGAITYIYMTLKNGLLEKIMPSYAQKINKLLKL